MKAEENVKQVYPDAYIVSSYCSRGGPDEYAVYRYGANGAFSGYFTSTAKAWANVWRRIQQERKQPVADIDGGGLREVKHGNH